MANEVNEAKWSGEEEERVTAAQIEDEGALGAVEDATPALDAVMADDAAETSAETSAETGAETAADAHGADPAASDPSIDSGRHPMDALPLTSTSDIEAPSFMSEVPEGFSNLDDHGPADGVGAIHSDDGEGERSVGAASAIVVRGESREARSPDSLMLVSDAPGDECRIALVRKGRLESFFGERQATATNVGNIYKGRVINVEPAIQAAFVDFGESQNGFLHVSDLHPRYFPGAERTEAVGRKIPRRDRPPIQEALRRGQEILVQVIKEGLGTKGPTLTSYLSIPGRLLVMMPEMDNVGVSRKVDDEEQRRQMRKILDSLDLPAGFGFILRTAGFDRSRTELQRDAAYLTRLWLAMEKRMERSGAPCELYTESDLLLRTIRDVVDDSVSTIVVDSESAFDRASLYLEVAFPKDPPDVRFYDKPIPIFHAFGLEPQVRSIYTREVPLQSGGALVFDQAEAMVAIDVNSGKSRSARDSETNAFNTNREAVDEICRQLRLRDLGGLVVCDLIDMRSAKHRREIEERFRENLRRDRAKTTVLSISEFGLIELTRQRMRPSVQKMHFMACPHCEGLGQVQIPDSTAASALRDVQALLGHERVHRVEMVCSVKVASVMLSAKRERLYEIERRSGKRVDVRISEALPMDRIDLYGYDDRGADVELARLALPKPPPLSSLLLEPPEELEVREATAETGEGNGRRRKRRRRPAPADAASIAMAGGFDDLPVVRGDEPSAIDEIRAREKSKREADAAKAARKESERASAAGGADDDDEGEADAPATSGRGARGERTEQGEGEGSGRRRRRRRGRGRGGDGGGVNDAAAGPRGTTPAGRGSPASAKAPIARPKAVAAPPPPPPPEPRRVHLLAKDLGVSSKDLLASLRAHETPERVLEAKNHMSMLASEWVALAIRLHAPEQAPPEADGLDGDGATEHETIGHDDSESAAEGDGHAPHDGHGDGPAGEGGRRKRRRRRRGRRGRGGEGAEGGAPRAEGGNPRGDGGASRGDSGAPRGDGSSPSANGAAPRGGRGSPRPEGAPQGERSEERPEVAGNDREETGPGGPGEGGGRRKRRRRRRGRGGSGGNGGNGGGDAGADAPRARESTQSASTPSAPPSAPPPASSPPKPRGLYARGVRRLSGPVKYDDR